MSWELGRPAEAGDTGSFKDELGTPPRGPVRSPDGASLAEPETTRGLSPSVAKRLADHTLQVVSRADYVRIPYDDIVEALDDIDDVTGVADLPMSYRPKDGGTYLAKEVGRVERRVVAAEGRFDTAAVEIVQEPATGWLQSTWASGVQAPPEAEQVGRIVILGSKGVSVADGGTHTSTYCYCLTAPEVSFEGILTDPDVSRALTALADDPTSVALRSAATIAIAHVRPAGELDWAELAIPDGATSRAPGAGSLNGTIAIVDSFGASIGGTVHHRSRFVSTLSPTLDAAMALAGNRDLAGLLVTVACDGDSRSLGRLGAGLSAFLVAEMGDAPVLAKRTLVERPPGAGEVLTVRREHGAVVSAGMRIVDSTEHLVEGLRLEPQVGIVRTVAEQEEDYSSAVAAPGQIKHKGKQY